MAVALQVLSVDVTRRKKRITYKVTFSGNYATGGDTANLSAATNPKFLPGAYPSRAPEVVDIIGNPGGNGAEFVLGTTMANGAIKQFSAANTELGAGAYNAAVTGDANIQLEAYWPLGV